MYFPANVASDPLFDGGIKTCHEWGETLLHTGRQKLCSPPLDVVYCPACDLEYWRRTAEA
jgi:hypothetical protein